MWSGLSLGVTPALTALLAPFWGRLADRFGRKIMVERSLASFVVVMSAMAFVTQAVARLRAAGDPGALRRLRRADADDGGGFGAEGAHGAGDRTVQTAQRLGPALGPVIGGTVAQIGRAAARVPGDRRLLCRRARAGVRDVPRAVDTWTTGPCVRAGPGELSYGARVRELRVADGGRASVCSSSIAASARSCRCTSRRLARRSRGFRSSPGVLFSIAAGTAALGNYLCAGSSIARRRGA